MSLVSLATHKTNKPIQPAKGSDLMPFGKYKGTKLGDVPSWYLIWCFDEDWFVTRYPAIYMYISNNYDALEHDNEKNDTRDFD